MAASPTVNMFIAPPSSIRDLTAGHRQFVVSNPDYIEVPGLLSIREVRFDGVLIEEIHSETVMVDRTRKNFKTITIALWGIMDGVNGKILCRSTKSNDGKWQVGSIVSILGDWEDEKTTGKK